MKRRNQPDRVHQMEDRYWVANQGLDERLRIVLELLNTALVALYQRDDRKAKALLIKAIEVAGDEVVV